jgi:protein-tyrosine phosphatase
MTGPDPVQVLAVCTGNICRSPALELRLRAALGPGADVVVSSAGVRALVGQPVDPAMAALLGDVPQDLRARQLVPDVVRPAGLVLALTRDQRAAVVGAVPAAVRRTFTLLEFADLASAAAADGALEGTTSPGQALVRLVQAAPRYRGARAIDEDDIEDPYRRGPEVFARVLAAIDDAVAALARVLPVDTDGGRTASS